VLDMRVIWRVDQGFRQRSSRHGIEAGSGYAVGA
jgi:hypothetical protein